MICPEGSTDFTRHSIDANYGVDNHGHGTHVAGLISMGLRKIDYCLVILKFYDPYAPGSNLKNTIKAFKKAIELKVDIINYSAGGVDYEVSEREVVEEALDAGIRVVAAAGNEGTELHAEGIGIDPKAPPRLIATGGPTPTPTPKLECNYYPACYDKRIDIVGNKLDDYIPASRSNYGSAITTYKKANSILALAPHNKLARMSGTSQAAAIRTAEVAREIYSVKTLHCVELLKSLNLDDYKLACDLQ